MTELKETIAQGTNVANKNQNSQKKMRKRSTQKTIKQNSKKTMRKPVT